MASAASSRVSPQKKQFNQTRLARMLAGEQVESIVESKELVIIVVNLELLDINLGSRHSPPRF